MHAHVQAEAMPVKEKKEKIKTVELLVINDRARYKQLGTRTELETRKIVK